jgi:hypothetical protein
VIGSLHFCHLLWKMLGASYTHPPNMLSPPPQPGPPPLGVTKCRDSACGKPTVTALMRHLRGLLVAGMAHWLWEKDSPGVKLYNYVA